MGYDLQLPTLISAVTVNWQTGWSRTDICSVILIVVVIDIGQRNGELRQAPVVRIFQRDYQFALTLPTVSRYHQRYAPQSAHRRDQRLADLMTVSELADDCRRCWCFPGDIGILELREAYGVNHQCKHPVGNHQLNEKYF